MGGQTDQNSRFCFSVICLLVPAFRTRTHVIHVINVSVRVSAVPVLPEFEQETCRRIRSIEESIATDSGDTQSAKQHSCPLNYDTMDECVYLNYDHGAQQALLREYVDLGSHPTYVIVDPGCTRAMGSRFAIDRLVQACQQHPKA